MTMISDSERRSGRDVCQLLLLVTIPFALLGSNILFGNPPTTAYVADDFILFDNAWRIANGQVPSNDFYSPLGFAFLGFFGYALSLGKSISSFYCAQLALNFAITVGFLFATDGVRKLTRLFLLLSVALVLYSPTQYNLCPTCLGFGAYYNKISTALLCLLLLIQVRAVQTGLTPASVAAMGFINAILFATKFSAFLPSAALCCIYCLIEIVAHRISGVPTTWRQLQQPILRIIILLVSFIISVSFLLFLFGVSLEAYIHDLIRASHARLGSGEFNGVEALLPKFQNLLELRLYAMTYFFLFFVYLAVFSFSVPLQPPVQTAKVTLLTAWAFAVVYYLQITNSQNIDSAFIAFSISALFYFRTDSTLFNVVWRSGQPLARGVTATFCGIVVSSLMTLALLPYGIGLGYSYYARLSTRAIQTTSPLFGDVYVCCLAADNKGYVDSVANLKRDLLTLKLDQFTIFAMDFTNPFPFLLRSPPPINRASWWHSGVTIGVGELLNPELVANACILVDMKDSNHPNEAERIRSAFAARIDKDYQIRRDTKYGAIYQRRDNCGLER